MIIALLGAALSAAPPSDAVGDLTAGQLRGGCVTSQRPGPPPSTDSDQVLASAFCQILIAVELALAEMNSIDANPGAPSPERRVCLPRDLTGDEGSALLARTFIAYVDAHPEVRNADGAEIFERALAEKWPCPR